MLRVDPQRDVRPTGRRARLTLFSGGGNPQLARELADALDEPLAEMTLFR